MKHVPKARCRLRHLYQYRLNCRPGNSRLHGLFFSATVLAIKPPTGATTNVAAICDNKTTAIKTAVSFVLIGIKQSNNKVTEQRLIPIKYHLCKLSVRSVSGAHTKRHRFAEIPNAVMEAAAATEKSCCIKRKGSVTVANPELMP